ncbi:MAG: Gfo/Idh/MocA family oxidoreductase, partial [Candidatus Omnitrophota bacterium]
MVKKRYERINLYILNLKYDMLTYELTFVERFVIILYAMNKLKVGVIGIGRLGSIHTRVYSELDNVDLVGICDIDQKKLEKVTGQFKVPSFLSHNDLLNKVDAISIAVPTNKHYEIAKDFINKGVHLLVEKPITNDLAQAAELIELAKKNKVILQVGHVERFNSAFSAVEKIIKNPRFIECHRLSPFPHRSLDIGVVLDVMIHDIDIILGLVKSEIKTVDAVGVPVLTSFEDIANARITFQNGCVCNLTASRISDEAMRKIRIFLSDTYISLDYGSQEAFLYRKEIGQITKEMLPIEKEEPLKREIESFIDCVINNKRPLVTGEEAYQALQLSDKILKEIWGKKKIFVVAGEVSGDIHAASLIKELKIMNPALKFMGLGGKHLQEEGVELFFDLTKLAVVGFTEVLKNILLFRRIFWDFIKRAEQEKPDAIILVDYPGFNLRLAKELKQRGFKVIYYISPQVWAWGEKR